MSFFAIENLTRHMRFLMDLSPNLLRVFVTVNVVLSTGADVAGVRKKNSVITDTFEKRSRVVFTFLTVPLCVSQVFINLIPQMALFDSHALL